MPLINLSLTGVEASTSATKATIENAKMVLGAKGEAIVKRMEELVKIKELDTAKIEYVLDQIKTGTEADLQKWKTSAGGKTTIKGVRALVSAKSLVQVINALRAIKVPRVATKTGVKGTAGVVAKTRTPTKPVVAQRTDTQKPLPKVTLSSISPKFMNTVSQAQIDSIAAQLSEATGFTFAGQAVENANGQSSPWTFVALNPNARYVSVSIDPPFYFNEYSSSAAWGVSAQTKGGKFAFGKQLRKPTVQALAKEVRAVVNTASKVAKAVKKLDMPKTYKITELRRMTHTQRVAFTKRLNLVLGLDSLVYGISNNGESFKSEPGEEWEMQGHLGGSNVFITFDGPYDNEQTGKWSVSMNDLDDGEQESFDANDFDGMRSFIHNNKK